MLVLLLGVSLAWAQENQPQEPKKEVEVANPRVLMETSLGSITLELDAAKAPISVENFLAYVRDGFYDGTVFHRVMKTFMIQGGGYDAELNQKTQGLRAPIKNEWENGLKNVRGTIAMARRGGGPDSPNSATSQFFINVVDNPRLDAPQPDGAAYAVFGRVVEGMDVVDKIREVPVAQHPKVGMGPVTPVETVLIKSVRLLDASGKPAEGGHAQGAKEGTPPQIEKEEAKPKGEAQP